MDEIRSKNDWRSADARRVGETYKVNPSDIPSLAFLDRTFEESGVRLEEFAVKRGLERVMRMNASTAMIGYELAEREAFTIPYTVGSVREMVPEAPIPAEYIDSKVLPFNARRSGTVEQHLESARHYEGLAAQIKPGVNIGL